MLIKFRKLLFANKGTFMAFEGLTQFKRKPLYTSTDLRYKYTGTCLQLFENRD